MMSHSQSPGNKQPQHSLNMQALQQPPTASADQVYYFPSYTLHNTALRVALVLNQRQAPQHAPQHRLQLAARPALPHWAPHLRRLASRLLSVKDLAPCLRHVHVPPHVSACQRQRRQGQGCQASALALRPRPSPPAAAPRWRAARACSAARRRLRTPSVRPRPPRRAPGPAARGPGTARPSRPPSAQQGIS